MDKLYSFVLPAYKAKFLKEAIDSILAQTYTNFELIIVNDASPEDLESIVKPYDDSRIQYYVNIENVGGKDLVAQWNRCLEYAKGEYVILASDDDVYFPQYLERMDYLVRKYPEVNLLRPRVQFINMEGSIIRVGGWIADLSSPLEFAYYKNNASSGLQFYLFKRKPLMSIGGFNNYPMAWFSDDATVIRMANKGVAFLGEILFSFRLSGDSISTQCNNELMLRLKTKATISYYDDLPRLLEELPEWKVLDAWFKKTILSKTHSDMKAHLLWLFDCSTKKARIKILPLFHRTSVFSIWELTKMFVRKLILG